MEIDKPTMGLLDGMGFKPGKDEKLYEIKIEGGFAYIDFRTTDGRRYAMIDRKPVPEKDLAEKAPILIEFKKRRDEIQNELLKSIGASAGVNSSDNMPSIQTNKGLESPPQQPIQEHPAPPKPGLQSSGEAVFLDKKTPLPPHHAPPPDKLKSVFWDEIVPLYEIDICELFGGAGDGKSRVAKKIAEEALDRGRKVLYVDTERGFLKRDLQKLGNAYRYISNLKGVMDLVKNMPKDIDVFILDSVGYPVLTEWAKMGVNERGNALTQIIAIKDLVKDWAINNSKVALVINQPDSDFGKEQGYVNRPFGDKGQFIIKEVFLIKRISSTTLMTKSVIESFRSRHDARGIRIAEVEITSEGVKII